VFGFATFGTVYGTIICLSGLFTFSQAALQALVHDAFDDDPGPVNLALAAVGLLIGVVLVMYVDVAGRVVRQERAEDDDRRSLLGDRGSLHGERQSLLRPRTSRPTLEAVRESFREAYEA